MQFQGTDGGSSPELEKLGCLICIVVNEFKSAGLISCLYLLGSRSKSTRTARLRSLKRNKMVQRLSLRIVANCKLMFVTIKSL